MLSDNEFSVDLGHGLMPWWIFYLDAQDLNSFVGAPTQAS